MYWGFGVLQLEFQLSVHFDLVLFYKLQGIDMIQLLPLPNDVDFSWTFESNKMTVEFWNTLNWQDLFPSHIFAMIIVWCTYVLNYKALSSRLQISCSVTTIKVISPVKIIKLKNLCFQYLLEILLYKFLPK